MRKKFLITGPGGRVGTRIVPLLREHFALRLFDLQPLRAEGDDEIIQGDISDFPRLLEACRGADALLHLAAISDEDDFHSKLLPINLAGVHNAFEAARIAGVGKIIFTSTGQTMLNYGVDKPVNLDMPVRPSSVYACTKIFGEALARHYSDCHGLSIICIRLCWFQGYDSPLFKQQPDYLMQWCSPRDLAQLIRKSVESDLRFATVFGLSNNTGGPWDNTPARTLLGFQPEDDSAQFR